MKLQTERIASFIWTVLRCLFSVEIDAGISSISKQMKDSVYVKFLINTTMGTIFNRDPFHQVKVDGCKCASFNDKIVESIYSNLHMLGTDMLNPEMDSCIAWDVIGENILSMLDILDAIDEGSVYTLPVHIIQHLIAEEMKGECDRDLVRFMIYLLK